jgi:hypothetical protein
MIRHPDLSISSEPGVQVRPHLLTQSVFVQPKIVHFEIFLTFPFIYQSRVPFRQLEIIVVIFPLFELSLLSRSRCCSGLFLDRYVATEQEQVVRQVCRKQGGLVEDKPIGP